MSVAKLRSRYARVTRVLATCLGVALLIAALAQLAMWALGVETGEMR